MPPGVNPEALARWEQWLAFKGKPANDLSRPAIARRLVSFGDAAQQSIVVEHSIAGQYQQLYPPKPDLAIAGGTAGKPRARPKTADEYEEEYRRAQ